MQADRKVIYISQSVPLSETASIGHVMEMCEAYTQKKASVRCFLRHGTTKLSDDELYHFYGIRPKSELKLTYYHSFRDRLRFLNTAIEFSISFRVLIPLLFFSSQTIVHSRSVIASIIPALLGIPTLIELHAPKDQLGRIERLVLRYLPKISQRNVVLGCISNKIYHSISNLSAKTLLIPDGAKIVNKISNQKYDKKELKKKTNFVVRYAGSIRDGRGIDLIYELAKKRPDYKFEIAGFGDRNILDSFKNRKNFRYIGMLPKSDVAKFLEEADALVAPYRNYVLVAGDYRNTVDYMSPLKIFEYLAANVPILASDLPAVREILSQDHAFLCDPNDIQAWLSALDKIANQPDQALEVARRGHKLLLDSYSWDKRTEKILKTFDLSEK